MGRNLTFEEFDFLESPDTDITIKQESNHDIAIIGMSINLPMASDLNEFRENLKSGMNCISDFPDLRKKDIDQYLNYKNENVAENTYVKRGYLSSIDSFDYKFFRMTPKEASLMNPFQRLVLETFYKTIEDAGYGGSKIKSTNTGVYLGFISDLEGYKYREMIMNVESDDNIQISIPGNLSSMMVSRISYLLDLKGPSMMIDTACSSSLVALHTACQALRNGDCNMAVVGGIRLSIIPVETPFKIGIESSDFLAKTFDNSSDGTGTGEGVIALMLKPLKNAKLDGDNIHAIIKGSAINQDGTSMGITAPNAKAQTEVIIKAWEDAGVSPENISYIEAHGTGTKLGDPIEIDALDKAFKRYTDRKQFCAIGSVKTNIGHLYEAAGLAGVVKAILSLKNKELYPNIHFNRPNTRINFADSPVFVVDKFKNWEVDGTRVCGVSSFGFSGTNCHVVLEEFARENIEECKPKDSLQAFTLSAKSRNSLIGLLEKYIDFLQKNKDLNLSEVCYTANTGRDVFTHRLGLMANSVEELTDKLKILKDRLKEFENSEKEIKIEDQGIYYFEKANTSKNSECENSTLLFTLKDNKDMDFERTNIIEAEHIDKLLKDFAMGGNVDWESLYEGNRPNKVSLPTYCFENTRCWIKVPEIELSCQDTNMFYSVNWVLNEPNIPEISPKEESIIVFADNKVSKDKYLKDIYAVYKNIVLVEPGEAFLKISDSNYIVGQSQKDYDDLFEDLSRISFSNIVHMFSLIQQIEDTDKYMNHNLLQNAQDRGVKSLLRLTKGLLKVRVSRTNIIVLSQYVNQVDGTEKEIKPENSPVFGLCKVIPKENINIRCRCIDIDESFNSQNLIVELESEFDNGIYAYRNGKRYIEELDETLNIEENCKDVQLSTEGVYIITGGLGGLGLEVAKYLTSKAPINVALINRKGFPLKSEWEDILKGNDTILCEKVVSLRDIEANGSKVECIGVNIANYLQLEEVVNELRVRYGSIKGIIHAAGVAGKGFIINKDESKFSEVLSPKIEGTWNLYEATKQDNLEFFVMFSSGISVFGPAGQGDYSAANSYLDSMAYYLRSKNIKAMAINWAAWKEVGMAKDNGFGQGQLIFREIVTNTGLNALETSLKNDFTRVLIGELNYTRQLLDILEKLPVKISSRMKTKITNIIKTEDKGQKGYYEKEKNKKEFTEVKLTGRESGSYSEVEVKIARICREILGFEEISINDNFLEIGADSILLAKIHERLEAEFPNTITMSQMFVYPTISKLSNYINSTAASSGADLGNELNNEDKNDISNEINDMFSKIESNDLSLDDAIDFIEKM